MTKLLIYTDGGARGNPGPAAVGFIIYLSGEIQSTVFSSGEKIGITTNNIAEYKAVLKALQWILHNNDRFPTVSEIHFFLDSNLVVNQLNGKFKVKNQTLVNLFYSIKEIEKQLSFKIQYFYIPRENNLQADILVNKALDS